MGERSSPPITDAREALATARRRRAEQLVALAEGRVTPLEVVHAAATEAGRPLRRISLKQLHLTQHGWGERRTSRLLVGLAARLGLHPDQVADKQISWLIDPRAGGRRYLAWLDVQHPKASGPWTGFPYAPQGRRGSQLDDG